MKDRDNMSLEDKGWLAMQKLLDKEMPTRRVVPLWWFGSAAAALLVLVVIGWMWYPDMIVDQVVSEKIVPLQESEESIRDTKSSVGEDIVATAEPEEEKDMALNSSPSQAFSQSTVPPAGESKAAGNANLDQLSASDVRERKEDDDSAIALTESTVLTRKDLPANNESPSGDDGIEEAVRGFRDQPAVTILPGRALPPLEIHQILEGLSFADWEQEIIEVEKPERWSWGLQGGVSSTVALQKPGFHAGGMIDYQLGKNFSLGIGASWWRMKDNEDFSYLQEGGQIADFYQLEPQLTNSDRMDNVSSLTNGTIYSGSTQTLTYLRLPLTLTIFPTSTFSPHVGVSMISLLSNERSGLVQLEAMPNMPSSVSLEKIPDLVRKNNFSLDVGLDIGISRRLGLDITYLHGFNSYINYEIGNGGVPELHRSFWASFRVKF